MKLLVCIAFVLWYLVQGCASLRDTDNDAFPHSNTYRRMGPCSRKTKHGSRCLGLKGQPDGICLTDIGNKHCISSRTEKFKFTIEAKYLPKSKKSQGGNPVKRLFIRGTGPVLSQENPIQLSKSARNIHTWTTDISYTSDSDGLTCNYLDHCSLNQGTMQFRLYLDENGKQGMLGSDFVIHLPISRSLSGSRQFLTPKVAVYPWFNQKSSTIKQFKQTISIGSDDKIHVQVTLVYPASYNENIFKRYKLVLLLDSDKHYIPQVDYLSSHIGLIDELFLLLVSPSDIVRELRQDNRTYLLPFDSFLMECGTQSMEQCIECHHCRDTERIEPCDTDEFIARSKRCMYLRHNKGTDQEEINIVIDTMIEMVEKKVGSDRLILDPPGKRVTVIGFGEHAVTAFILGLSRPDVFGNIGCLSPKFYLPMTAEFQLKYWILNYVDDIAVKYMDHSLPRLGCSVLHTSQKYYFSHGQNDDVNFPLGKIIQTTLDVMNKLKHKFRLKDRDNIMYQLIKDQGLLYPDNTSFPLMSLLQIPLLYFHQSEGGLSAHLAPDIDTINQYFMKNAAAASATVEDGSNTGSARNDNVIEINYRRTLDGDIEVATDQQCTVSYDDVPLSFVIVSVGKYNNFIVCYYLSYISVYNYALGGSVAVSVILVVIMMCLKEENKQAAKQKEQEEKELLEELSTDDEL